MKAVLHHYLETQRKGEMPKRVRESNKVVKIDSEGFWGDGGATVGRSFTFRLGLPYSEATTSSHMSVNLTCNQDKKTIKQAAIIGRNLALGVLDEDLDDMYKFLEGAAEKLKEINS